MTQDNLQQAYDRAMAHNAMLRDGVRNLQDMDIEDLANESFDLCEHLLNATEADVTAWLNEKLIDHGYDCIISGMDAVEPRLQQQLATVTAERDAREKALSFYAKGNHIKYSGGYDSTADMTIEIIDHGEVARAALAQKGG